jgi:serine/threonine protein kinase
VVGKYLGHGGFCTVTELQATKLKDGGKNDEEPEAGARTQNRSYIAANYLRNGEARYAIKKLTKDLYQARPEQTFISGVIDIMIEVKYLSVISHPNIIKMRAIADSEPSSRDFFIVLDRLDETLTQRVDVWKKEKGKGRMFKKSKDDETDFTHRLIVGLDIVSALKYLHDNNIVYR